MRKYFYTLYSLLLMSCGDFLEKHPTDFMSPEKYYKTENELETALRGVYDILGQEYVYGKWYQLQIAVGTDETYMTGIQPSGSLNTYQHDPSNTYLTNFWRYLYFGIERANILISNVERADVNELKKNTILGEGLFLRAYYYFLLVTHFGDVPLKLEPTPSINNTDIIRTDKKVVYDHIIEDMKKAELLLESQTASDLGFGGRVSLSVVRGVLARVYLHMAGYPLLDKEKYEEVIIYTKKIIDSKVHELNPSFERIFINYAQDLYDVKETIWEVELWGNRLEGAYVEAGQIGSISGPFSNDVVIGKSTGSIKTTGLLFKTYEYDNASTGSVKYSPDLRRDWTCVQYTYGTATSNPNHDKTPSLEKYNMSLGKWRREFETLTPKHGTYTPQNFPLLRFSDVLLMYAEADNEVNGVTEEAKEAVKLVRDRAYGKNLTGSRIKKITVTNGGSGYVSASPPKVNVLGGSNAEAFAVVEGGQVKEIIVTRVGQDFTNAPLISIEGGVGAGATAFATLVNPQSIQSDLTAEDLSSQDAFRLAIQRERMLEFAGENLRRQDLIRWGVFVQNIRMSAKDIRDNAPENRKYTSQSGDNVSERDLLLPIPSYDRNLNKLLSQNKGW